MEKTNVSVHFINRGCISLYGLFLAQLCVVSIKMFLLNLLTDKLNQQETHQTVLNTGSTVVVHSCSECYYLVSNLDNGWVDEMGLLYYF